MCAGGTGQERACAVVTGTTGVVAAVRPQLVLQALQSGAEKETKAERAFVVEMNNHRNDCDDLQGSVSLRLRFSPTPANHASPLTVLCTMPVDL